MPTSDAEVLETLLARVMRLVAMDGDSPAGGLAETTLSMAEGVLLVDLLDSDGATQQQLANRLNLDRAGLAGSAANWSSSNWSPVNGTKRIAATCSSASDLQELR